MLENIVEGLSSALQKKIKGFKAISLCNLESKEVMFSESYSENFDIDLLSAYNLDLVKTKLYALEVIGISGDLKDVVINLNTEVHIVDLSKCKKYFIYLAIDDVNTDLNLVKQTLKKYKAKLDEALCDKAVLKIV